MSDYTPTTEEVREAWMAERYERDDIYGSQSRDEFNRWLASVLAEQGEPIIGEIRALAFEDGEDHGPECGDDECLCADHDGPPRPKGTYATIRLDDHPSLGFWRVGIQRLPVEENKPESTDGRER